MWNSADALASLYATVVNDMGASPTGRLSVHRGDGIRSESFISKTDLELSEVKVPTATLVRELFSPNVRVCEIEVRGLPIMRNASGLISYLALSEQSYTDECHPVAVLADGSIFDGPVRNEYAARRLGLKIVRNFHRILSTQRPAYAAILIGMDLPSLSDLKIDPKTFAFSNAFYFSETFTGPTRCAQLLRLYHSGYKEQIADGYYISCYRFFNKQGIDAEGYRLSENAAEIIGQIPRPRGGA
jgi:hypothetical protein